MAVKRKYSQVRLRSDVHVGAQRLASQASWRVEQPVSVVDIIAWALEVAKEEFKKLPDQYTSVYNPGLNELADENPGEIEEIYEDFGESLSKHEPWALNLWRAAEKFRFMVPYSEKTVNLYPIKDEESTKW
jgi:hypothetical protein